MQHVRKEFTFTVHANRLLINAQTAIHRLGAHSQRLASCGCLPGLTTITESIWQLDHKYSGDNSLLTVRKSLPSPVGLK